MAELTASDREELSRVIGEAVMFEDSQEFVPADLGGAKDLFCEHWATVKTVLQFLASQVGPIVGQSRRSSPQAISCTVESAAHNRVKSAAAMIA